MTFAVHIGDAIEQMAGMAPESMDAVIADLPYGTTQNPWDSIIPLDQFWASVWRICKPTAPVVLTATQPFTAALVMSQTKHFKHEWIWEKEAGTGFFNAKLAPLRAHESVLVFCRGTPKYHPQMRLGHRPYSTTRGATQTPNYGHGNVQSHTVSQGERYPVSVIHFPRDRDGHHPTQKPVALMRYLVETYTDPSDVVLDPTCGSGSTGVACIAAGRQFVGVEMAPEFAAIASERIAHEARQGLQQTIEGVA